MCLIVQLLHICAMCSSSNGLTALILSVAASVTSLHAQVSPPTARDTAALSTPVADVTGGKVRGAALVGGGAVFLGIPYARPPVGPLRWREPSPVEPWTGIRRANAYGPPCAQNPYFDPAVKETAREDCLYLNVWTPQLNAAGGAKPVMVWIPGGGNFAGASGERTSG